MAGRPFHTEDQISSGGVAFRRRDGRVDVALIRTHQDRWQLPKGLIDPGEKPEETALREVGEEAGLTTRLVAPLDVIEYWYFGHRRGERVRFHKQVHFFLLEYIEGRVEDHDYEVAEARWVQIEEAPALLAFDNEREVVEKAQTLIEESFRKSINNNHKEKDADQHT